jgi:hypothetical protein
MCQPLNENFQTSFFKVMIIFFLINPMFIISYQNRFPIPQDEDCPGFCNNPRHSNDPALSTTTKPKDIKARSPNSKLLSNGKYGNLLNEI